MSSGSSNSRVSSIPASSRKMVQSLKEIVNCPEHEIYAMLKECNMDPNDTVSRLLSLDPFHEVKSRREKKKEMKDMTETKPRGVGGISSRGGRGGTDHNVGRGGPALFNSTESGVLRGKPAYKKENGTNAFPSAGVTGNHINRRPPPHSDSLTPENKSLSVGTGDGISSSSQPSPGFQPTWVGVPGQVSMADIVKMGKPHGKTSSTPMVSTETSYLPHNAVVPNSSLQSVKHPHVSAPLPVNSHHDLRSQDPVSKVSEVMQEPGIVASQNVSDDEWPVSDSGSPVLEPYAASEAYAEPSNLHIDRENLHLNSPSDDIRASKGDVSVENIHMDHIRSDSGPSRLIQEDSSRSASHFDDDSLKHMNSYQPHHQEVEDVNIAVSSAAASFQQLSLQKEGQGVSPAEANPAVVIPDHLQVPAADCSHLSFGSFGSGISTTFPGSFVSKPSKSNLEEASIAEDVTPAGHTDTRNPEYYTDEQPRSTSDGNVAHRSDAGTENYDLPSTSQPEVMKQETPEERHSHQYTLPSSVPGYTFENSQQPNAAFSYALTNYQMQNLAPFSSVMQPYTSSLPSHLLASTVQPVRESDLPYSPFLTTQSMPTKYSNVMSSISGPTISMPEAVKSGGYSTPQPTPQSLPGTSIATGPALPQHLTVHPYTQPTLPLGHFSNMIGYPFLPQSYTYMPSAFQQAYTGNNAYHQSPAAVHSAGIKYTLPQYKNSVPVSSLPQSASIASGYGGFGSSTNIPGNFSLNPSTTPTSTAIGYEDVISSQYKDNNSFVPLQQNEGSAPWVHGAGSRTMSAVPASTYYNLQGQNQQHGGFRQSQQPSQHFGALGYPNFYHSQTGVTQEHQPQNLSDGTFSGSQGSSSKQSHQFWQQTY